MTRKWHALRAALLGLALALAVIGGERLLEALALGVSNEQAVRRLSAATQEQFEREAQTLERAGTQLAEVMAGLSPRLDAPLIGRLFAAAEAARPVGRSDDFALTTFGGDGRPIAWAGRPSDADSLCAGVTPSWRVARTTVGPRLLYCLSVLDSGGARIGAVVAERSLTTTAMSVQSPDVPLALSGWRAELVALESPPPAPAAAGPDHFELRPAGGEPLLLGSVDVPALEQFRERWRARAGSVAASVVALSLLLAAYLGTRGGRLGTSRTVLLTIVAVVGAWMLLHGAAATWTDLPVFNPDVFISTQWPTLLSSAFDVLVTGAATCAVTCLLLITGERWRHQWRGRRLSPVRPRLAAQFVLTQLGAGVVVGLVLMTDTVVVADVVAASSRDLLHFSLHPWDSTRLALQVGLILWHTSVVTLALATLRAAIAPWRLPIRRTLWSMGAASCWALPILAFAFWQGDTGARFTGLAVLALGLGGLALITSYVWRAYRHATRALQWTMLVTGFVVPAVLSYPLVYGVARSDKADRVANRFANQALGQRQTVQDLLTRSLLVLDEDIDSRDAFDLWRQTPLAEFPITSSIDIYDDSGDLISRYAFNLPEDLAAPPRWREAGCDWAIFEEVSPFFADERLMLHAGRSLCDGGLDDPTRSSGSVVVHTTLDYENLAFISSRNPYLELVRDDDSAIAEGLSVDDIEYAVYGWSRTPVFSSTGRVWPLPDEVFAQIQQSRTPHWTRLIRGARWYEVHVSNDRFGIYALGYPADTALDHALNLAELTVLAVLTSMAVLFLALVSLRAVRERLRGRALLSEIRASFYHKLFLAFVAATVIPVVALAVATRYYVASEIGTSIEEEAIRIVASARRVVEDLASTRTELTSVLLDDNLMVWVSRLIGQDINVFENDRLLATSERNLFAAGLLSIRTPAGLFQSVALRREGAVVSTEQIGSLEYLVAATPVTSGAIAGILSVPLTSRQQDIERQIDTFDRRVLLAVLMLSIAGAGLGYSMAERIADPVNRLTRATRRIARGELTTRVTPTSSDELRRLVQDFNQMARELQRQQGELERSHRLAAWAEMASQIAHEIKNPLTPIQLNAEHLRRVHEDLGSPLGAVLRDCVENILEQVRLLRRIASDFSGLASSPTPHLVLLDVPKLLAAVLDPYLQGLEGRIRVSATVESNLPRAHIDEILVSRALTNIIENSLHAMPDTGTLTIHTLASPGSITLDIRDTGVGMDAQSLARAFEPSFSTRVSGTGLGLPIARRNIELCGGTIAIASEPARGTTVTVRLPAEPSVLEATSLG